MYIYNYNYNYIVLHNYSEQSEVTTCYLRHCLNWSQRSKMVNMYT